jgi:hypothetical protein
MLKLTGHQELQLFQYTCTKVWYILVIKYMINHHTFGTKFTEVLGYTRAHAYTYTVIRVLDIICNAHSQNNQTKKDATVIHAHDCAYRSFSVYLLGMSISAIMRMAKLPALIVNHVIG